MLPLRTSQQEVEEIKPFLQQIQEKFEGEGVFLFDENNKFRIITSDNPRQPNTWDCGVYLCLFVEFLSQNELYLLDEENPLITSQEDDEDAQLAEAIRLSLLINEEQQEQQLQEILLFSSQQQVNSQQIEKIETENLQQELANELEKLELEEKQAQIEQNIIRINNQTNWIIFNASSLRSRYSTGEDKIYDINSPYLRELLKEQIKTYHEGD
ncbi:9705_t:CDS:2 [Ambispora gerdemannii]|uniref:9705_t:CDS:1 n=1 Tax=Ambispora gerdemannii TaxID=144530 RepID=A0A9N9ABW8_9GLOM|nr:9705_t:CDS:2 [Ambispora gerdemannii]